MGWDVASKSVIRSNPDYTGPTVWSQDQVAGIKVIATRHDSHDQDLADAISATLNLDGINAMRANLSVGGFKLVNVAKGTVASDGARFGQTVTGMSFDDPTRTLTLTRADEVDLSVVISGGTGGGGSVTSIDIGEGLSGTNDPLTTIGDINLETIGALQTFSGGISSVTVDKHGRVTQVIEGAFANTNLSIGTRTSTTMEVVSSTGTNVNLPLVTTSLAGLMSASDKTVLDGLAGGSATNISVTENVSTVSINSSTGSGDIIAAATTFAAGVMRSTDKSKLDGIETGADVTDAVNVAAAGAVMDTDGAILDSDFGSTGIMIRQGTDTYTTTSLLAGNGITIANTSGTAGNPTISLRYTISTNAPTGTPADGQIWFRY